MNTSVSHAFKKGRSIITNARAHRNRRFVLSVDFRDFFNNIHFGRIEGFFQKKKYFGFSREAAIVIAQLTCYHGSLPQGAPTSPVLSNLICQIMDRRILELASKYRVHYSRYADDLTFSTNWANFGNESKNFLSELTVVIGQSGFQINESKTRLQYKDSRQEVTELIVNDKVGVPKRFVKNTRAMANTLYKTGQFEINGKQGSINQLEGRFTFINQIDWYNHRVIDGVEPTHSSTRARLMKLNSRERQYRQFLVYKYFISNSQPLIVTAGKTDIPYIKSALRSLNQQFPDLVTFNDEGEYSLKISFFERGIRLDHERSGNKKNQRLPYFLGLKMDGADELQHIYDYYTGKDSANYPPYAQTLIHSFHVVPQHPVILLFDHELSGGGRPLRKFLNGFKDTDKKKDEIEKNSFLHLCDNLFVVATPKVVGLKDSSIEDLFDANILAVEIAGKNLIDPEKMGMERLTMERRSSQDIFFGIIKTSASRDLSHCSSRFRQ